MTILNGDIEPEGALVDVLIGLSGTELHRLRLASSPIPAAVQLRGVLDTGAECTCIDLQAAGPLTLPVEGITLVNAPALGGLTASTQYDAGLTSLHPSGNPSDHLVSVDLVVADQPLGVLAYQVLIGRDVLARCAFLYNGMTGKFSLDY